jgi:hypothetical protein
MTEKPTITEYCPRHGYQEFWYASGARSATKGCNNTEEGLTCPICIPEPVEQHVDEFTAFGSKKPTDEREPNETYARWVLMLLRLPAIMRSAFAEYIEEYKLFCMYNGEYYRVIAASRFGQILLTKDFEKDTGSAGSDVFTYVNECSGWAAGNSQRAPG